jgi:hypothetical protein
MQFSANHMAGMSQSQIKAPFGGKLSLMPFDWCNRFG